MYCFVITSCQAVKVLIVIHHQTFGTISTLTLHDAQIPTADGTLPNSLFSAYHFRNVVKMIIQLIHCCTESRHFSYCSPEYVKCQAIIGNDFIIVRTIHRCTTPAKFVLLCELPEFIISSIAIVRRIIG